MSIGVQSYPELYTLLIGWDFYEKLWSLLTQTGIAYIPIIAIILKNVAKSYVVYGKDAGVYALRSMEISLLTTILLIFFGASPFLTISAHTVSFKPQCGNNNRVFYPGNTGTSYDQAFSDQTFSVPINDVHVPIWWYAVISVSEGMTNAANSMLGCVPNLRKMMAEVDTTQIPDPILKQDLHDFQNMCFKPAKAQYLDDTEKGNTANLNLIKRNTENYGLEDTEWPGSHAFSATYYRKLKATRPVAGFPYTSVDDVNADINSLAPPTNGTPTCRNWWNDSEYGLRNRLYHTLPKDFLRDFRVYVKDDSEKDNVVRALMNNNKSYSGYANSNDIISDFSYSHLASAIGVWYSQLSQYPKIYMASQSTPIIQALILLLIYVFLPFGLVFSGYKPSAFLYGAVLIFSVIFCGFIWHLIAWVDTTLITALYDGWFAKQGVGATLADMIIGYLMIFAPLFWFVFMGALGVMAGNALGDISQLTSVGDTAAAHGAKVTNQLAQKSLSTML